MMGWVTNRQPTGEGSRVPAARRLRAGRQRRTKRARPKTKEHTHEMASYPFLSDEWLDQARKIRAEYEGKTAPIPNVVRMNLVVTAVPFSEEDILAHMDTSSGELVLDTGHLETQDLKVTVD